MNQDQMWEAYQNDEAFDGVGCPGGGRHEFLLKRVMPNARALSIGVGSGAFEGMLVQSGTDLSCLDPSKTSIERIREKLSLGEKAKVGYSQSIPFADCSFDYVIMTEVIEHLDDMVLEGTLLEVKRVLKSGGRFIGTVPADENLNEGLVVCPHCAERFHRWGHQQSFSQSDLLRILRKQFASVNVRRLFAPDYRRLNWKGKVTSFLKMLQAACGLKGSRQNYYFEAVKN